MTRRFSIARPVPAVLRDSPGTCLTAREIARILMARFPAEIEHKRQRSRAAKTPRDSDAAMQQQLVAEIGAQRHAIQKKDPQIRTTEGRPRRCHFSAEGEADPEPAPAERPAPEMAIGATGASLSEAELYPRLITYLTQEPGVSAKRIDERRASNTKGRNGNRWLFPDVVGMQDPARCRGHLGKPDPDPGTRAQRCRLVLREQAGHRERGL